jgi:hypothetical protein
MSYRNLKIKNTGYFYESSKTPQEGFHEVETKTGGKVYHREFPTVEGELKGLFVADKDWGKIFTITLRDLNDPLLTISLDLNVFSSGERVNDYLKSFIQIMPALKVGEVIKISLNRKSLDKRGYLYKSMYVRDAQDNLLPWAFELKDVPRGVSSQSKVTGKTTWDFSDHDAFYYSKFTEYLDNIVKSDASTGQQQTAPAAKTAEEQKVADIVSDLPF